MAGCTGRLRFALRQLTLAWAFAFALLHAGHASAEGVPLPSPIPAGSSAEAHGSVRWLYPTRAESDVRPLMERTDAAWEKIRIALGAEHLDPELEVRVALDPRAMQALAPPGVRLPDYASGVALPERGLILLTLSAPGSWQRPDMQGVLVHELGHVALHRAVQGRAVPRWFTEGLAIYLAEERSLERIRTLWEGALGRRLYPLSELSRAFPAEHHRVNLAYAQSADMVRFMLEAGPGRLQALIAQLQKGASFDSAVHTAYDAGLTDLERDWHQSLNARFASWPLVLSSLTGLWAFGAVLLIVGYVRARRRHRATLRRWAIEEAPLMELALEPAARPKSSADSILDSLEHRRHSDPSVPSVEHEGQNHTLH